MKILFEGVDGAGKSTLSRWLAEELDPSAFLIAEPNHCLGGKGGTARIVEHGGSTDELQVATVRDIMLNPMVPHMPHEGLTKIKPTRPYAGHDYVPLGRALDPRISVPLTQANQARSAEIVRTFEEARAAAGQQLEPLNFVFDRSVISTMIYQGFAPESAEMRQGMIDLIMLSHNVTCTIDYDLTMILVGQNDNEERQIYQRIIDNRGGPEDDVYESAGFEGFVQRNRAYRDVFRRLEGFRNLDNHKTYDRFISRFGKVIIMSAHRPLDEMKKEVMRNVDDVRR